MRNVRTLVCLVFIMVLFAYGALFLEANQSEQYTIKTGDTLWKIAGEKLGDPTEWPRLWSYNESIVDPNSLCVGCVIEIPVDAEPVVVELPAVEEVEVLEVSEVSLDELPTVQTKKIHEIEKSLILRSGYIDKDFVPVGRIYSSPGANEIFGKNDYVYIKSATSHKKYYIANKSKKVKNFGNLIDVLGVCEVISEEDGVKKAIITASYGYIKLDDAIIPYYEFTPPTYVNEIKNDSIDGSIIAVKGITILSTDFDIVYINKGSKNALKPGQIYKIHDNQKKPRMQIGLVKILTVQEDTSSAYVVRSSVEVKKGDLINPVFN